MPITQFAQLRPGASVSIVLKTDQKTGRQVQGTVAQLLTRHNHPRGIKVKLTDGRVGRVQQLLSQPTIRSSTTMSNNNPWSNTHSQGNPYTNQQNQGSARGYYQPNSSQPQSQQHQQRQQQTSAPSQGVRPSDTDQFIAQQSDRAEQVEHMQQFEANAPQTEDDKIQAQLQKEFPNIDSSLIAAIYNERKGTGDLGEVKELLQELNSS